MNKTTKSFLVLYLFLCPLLLSGQSFFDMLKAPGDRTFAELCEDVEAFYSQQDGGRGSGYKQFKRWEWMMSTRLDGDGHVVNPAQKRFEAYQQAMVDGSLYPHQKTGSTTAWTSLGPTNYIDGVSGENGGLGRVNVLAFDPNNTARIFAGTPTGGLWRKAGNGPWTCLSDNVPELGVSGIAVSPSSHFEIFILTGDGDGRMPMVPSAGIMKTTNGGGNWVSVGPNLVGQDVFGYKLLYHPQNQQILYAVTSEGIRRTTDGGTNWPIVLPGNFFDLEFKPNNPSTIYACTNNAVYTSTSDGDPMTWTSSSIGPGDAVRAAIDVTPVHPNRVYAVVADDRGALASIQRSDDNGSTFTPIATSPNILGREFGASTSGQGDYDLTIQAHELTPNEVHVGGINHWQSTDAGSSWSQVTYWKEDFPNFDYCHADLHSLEWIGGNMWCGSDGGVFKRRLTAVGNIWEDQSVGLNIHQVYTIADHEPNPNLIYMGTQDNGTNRYNGSPTVEHQFLGDGTDVVIHPTNPDIVYSGFVSFSSQGFKSEVVKSIDGGDNWNVISPNVIQARNLAPPLEQNPNEPNKLFWGLSYIFRTTDGEEFHQLSNDTESDEPYTAIKLAPSNPNILYCVSPSHVIRSTNSGNDWTDITPPLPKNALPHTIGILPTNPNRIYLGLSGYEGGEKVYRSVDGGQSWYNASLNLPNVPINDLEVVQSNGYETVFAATDIGVFSYDLSFPFIPWQAMPALPPTLVTDLDYNISGGKLRAATFGRGIWEIDFVPPGPTRRVTSPSSSVAPTLHGYLGPMAGTLETLPPSEETDPVLSIFPNPASGHCLIDFNQDQEGRCQLQLHDLEGKLIQSVIEQSQVPAGRFRASLDVTDLAAGTYLLSFQSDHSKITKRVVVYHP